MSDIELTIVKLHRRLTADAHHRFRSWGHCYRYFRRRHRIRAQQHIDQAALQLGFYLASFGMYRPSGFLFQKDYRIHRYAVKHLLKPKYDMLLRVDFDSERKTDAAIGPLLALVSGLRQAYLDHSGTTNGRRGEVTDTLATKIVLAGLGCTPAYDRYFIKGLRRKGIAFSEFSGAHFLTVCEFYRDHAGEFKTVQRQIHENGIRYPVMRLVDMYFREVGQRKP